MASEYSKEETDIFVKVERQIEECFCCLEIQLANRKDKLLAELQKMKLEFTEILNSQEKTMKDLENARLLLHGIVLTQNLTSNLLQSSLAPIEKQISDLKISLVPSPKINFTWSTQILSDTLRKLGNINYEARPIDYSSKENAIQIISAEESVNCLHIECDYLYVACAVKVYVWNTITWKRVDEFEIPMDIATNIIPEQSSIIAITTKDNYVYASVLTHPIEHYFYLSDSLQYKICQFTKNRHRLIKSQSRTGGSCSFLGRATSVAISTEDELFVTDSTNDRVCVFDSNLFYRRQFGTEVLKNPTWIKMGDKLIVKDDNKQLHLFNKLGDHLGYLDDYGELNLTVINFWLDNANNLILSNGENVRIISPKGELLKKIGQDVKGEEVSGCGPVVTHGDKLIIACNAINCIKIF